MKIETKSLKKAVEYAEKVYAPTIALEYDTRGQVINLQFDDLSGNTTVITLSDSDSGIFDKITKTERF